jgi:hypothetical protein
MQFLIKSKREGFRRCGVAWPKGPTVFDEARFSPEEWARLKADPNLTVTEIAEPETDPEPEAEPEPAADPKQEAAASEKPGKARKGKE